jgi:hypothetical protein
MNKTLPKKYSVEFFHIYTDEKINQRHIESINQLKKSEKDWGFSYELIVLIDNYNPEKHTLKEDEVLNFLTDQKINLDFWAFEKDLIKNAEVLLDCINNNRILKNYRKYIERNNKYPCSLLTSAWYLTRLGYFKSDGLIKSLKKGKVFKPASGLINILPEDFKSIEKKVKQLILSSKFSEAADKIENLYYSTSESRAETLF